MATYDRTNNLPEEVSVIQNNVNEIKQSQIIGNDNLKVRLNTGYSGSQSLIANVTAVFRLTFTFNSNSSNLVVPRYSIFGLSTSYNLFFSADPSTVNDLSKKSWLLTITAISSVNISIDSYMECTDKGTATITRVS